MFQLYAEKNRLSVQEQEPLTSGSVNVYPVRFRFSPDWDGLSKTACFRSGTQTVTVLLDDSDTCVIPWEVTDPGDCGKVLYVGICGVRDGGVVLPTVWASLGVILEGVSVWGTASRPPTPSQCEQILAALESKQDKLTGLPGQVVGFDADGRPEAQTPQTGSGTADHRLLANRDAEEQHPIDAISGLRQAIEPLPKEPITIQELEEFIV